jgi:hypothetical protein
MLLEDLVGLLVGKVVVVGGSVGVDGFAVVMAVLVVVVIQKHIGG